MTKPIYFDYAATTPLDPRVASKMSEYLDSELNFANPGSPHFFGDRALVAIEKARSQVASLIASSPEEIIWTSGATEANNIAILGAAQFNQKKGKHIIVLASEHASVLSCASQLEQQGYQVTRLLPEKNGIVDFKVLEEAMQKDTILLSISHVNNEIGVVNDINKIGQLARAKNILFHVDAAQSAGKIVIDLTKMPVDLMTFSAHKNYGPKGIGALFIRHKPRARLAPIIFGGGQEKGLRPGTLATHQIVGMGEAFSLSQSEMLTDTTSITNLRKQFLNLLQGLDGITINGDIVNRIPGNLNICFDCIDGQSLLLKLIDLGIAVSSASACSSGSLKPSHVLKAIGLTDKQAFSSIRFTFGRFTTREDINNVAQATIKAVNFLREMSPYWRYKNNLDEFLNRVKWMI